MDANRSEYFKNYKEQRKRINLSVSFSDYQKIEYLAQQMQLKPTSYTYQVLQEKLGKNPNLSPEIEKELKELKLLVRNIANNINQIAHRSNTLKVMVEENALLMELKKLEDSVNEYVTQKAQT